MPPRLLGRLYLLAAVLAADSLLVSWIPHSTELLGPVAAFGIVFFAVFVGMGYSQLKLQEENHPFRAWLFTPHLVCILAVSLGNLAARRGFASQVDSFAGQLAQRSVLVLGVVLLALACLPLGSWIATLRATSPLWLFSTLAGAVASVLRSPFQSFWDGSDDGGGGILQIMTFRAVGTVLRLFLPDLSVDPATFIIGTPRFSVIVLKACSGLEGLGLVLVFTTVWLVYFRKESRFPQALLLVPCALAFAWILNIARISALVLIGDAGAREVAMVGFHSQAGWIAFTIVALTFSMATRKLAWVRRDPPEALRGAPGTALAGIEGSTVGADAAAIDPGEPPATRAYLVPFLAILAASYISRAASGYFEWLYPLRFVAAAVALWLFRAELRKLNWRFGWFAPATGAVVFLAWIGPAWWNRETTPSDLGASLAALSPAARFTWIAFRVAAAGITVPIAEELAFRGYLARRILDREFDEVAFSRLSLLSIAISSVAFGLLYGQHWLVGILAGLAYAAVLRRSGRFGDAVVAHATSNLLLAAWVLLRGDWSQW